MKALESVLVDAVATFFKSKGHAVFREVPILGQSADLVSANGEELTFVEVKVNSVKRAIEQCKAHELVADYVCIAVGTRSIKETNLSKVQAAGYGLISCGPDGECTWVVQPKKQLCIWPPARRSVRERMSEVS